MKEHTQTFNKTIFSHCPASRTNPFITILKERLTSCKDQLQSGAASLAIGTVFLLAVYLFFTQLAAYGWQ
ncbi:hypothetical protein [Desulfocastanea catecholica]